MSLDLGPALRAAIIDQQVPALQPIAAALIDLVGEYLGAPAVFAFRPPPEDAPSRIIIIGEDAAIDDEDGLRSDRPIVQRDILFYGDRGAPGTPADDSPKVEQAGYLMRQLFHKQRFSVRPEGYSVTEIVARGPVPAPADDESSIGRMVNLTIRLRRLA